MIRVDDLANANVLVLAEYLGVDALIMAVMVATYVNLHPNFSGTEEEAQEAFGDTYGISLKEAVIRGILPEALQKEQEHAGGKECANLEFAPETQGIDGVAITATELETDALADDNIVHRLTFPLLGGLNWLHYHGYSKLESKMKTVHPAGDEITFSRAASLPVDFACTQVLIGWWPQQKPTTQPRKTYALLLSNCNTCILCYAPHGGRDGPVPDGAVSHTFRNSKWCTLVRRTGRIEASPLKWLQDRKYFCREETLEAEFHHHIHNSVEVYFNERWERDYDSELYFQIYSRLLD